MHVPAPLDYFPAPDKQDKCVNEVIFCKKSAKNNFELTKRMQLYYRLHAILVIISQLIVFIYNYYNKSIRSALIQLDH